MNLIHSTLDTLRDRWTPVTHTSTFLTTGQVTPAEFILAGDYLVYKFPTWSWADASPPSKRVPYLPAGKQFLVTRGVPCHRRLDANFAGAAGTEEAVERDGLEGGDGKAGDEDDGWLRAGGGAVASQEARAREVRTVDDKGGVEAQEEEEEEEIPDMEDEEDDDEAIIRDGGSGTGTNSYVYTLPAPLPSELISRNHFQPPSHPRTNPLTCQHSSFRTYTLYITYTPYYRTPRLYLSGYLSPSEPLPPALMFEDIVGDHADKTVTLEDFPFFDAGVKMASIHPCKHASVMKTLLDRADAALKLRLERLRKRAEKEGSATAAGGGAGQQQVEKGMEGLVDQMSTAQIAERRGHAAGVAAAGGGEEWEVLPPGAGEEEPAIRVDQYLVVFLKFAASLAPAIEQDFTMGV